MSDDAQMRKTAESEAIVARFLQIHRYLNKYSKTISSQFGISGRQLSALRYLTRKDQATIGEMSTYLHITDSTTSELVDGLETKGLVQRARCAKDNRVVRVSLTPDGELLVVRAPLAGVSLMRVRLESLTDQEIDSIAQALERLSKLLGVDELQF
jgi:DNA-binding MarR family transcriptional regulator